MSIKNIDTEYSNKFIKVYNAEYDDGHHYYIASRRDKDNLSAIKDDYYFKTDKPDAVSCFIVIADGIHIPRLLLQYEYRNPLGRYILGVPAGLIEESDTKHLVYLTSIIKTTAIREIHEEIGINLEEINHDFNILSCGAFSSPGFTDESNAIVVITIKEDITDELNHDNAEINEHFGSFKLISYKEAERILHSFDKYPLMTYTALLWFISEGSMTPMLLV